MILYDPQQYRSPNRVWDEANRRFLDRWRTVADFDLWLCDGRHICIPAGFEYDKASIPRAVWWWLPRDDRRVIIAALVHDYLYVTKLVTRKEADQIFYQLLRDSGMRWTQAQAAYRGVRLGGWVGWRK